MVGEHHRNQSSARPGRRAGDRSRGRRHAWVAGLLGGMIALAVWGKLRFVSDVPRMAYADPEPRGEAETPPAPLNRGEQAFPN